MEVVFFFFSVLKDCIVIEGQDFVLQCFVWGILVFQIIWLLNGQFIQYVYFICEVGVVEFYIQDVLLEDYGIYICLVENVLGQVFCSVWVIVYEKKSSGKSEYFLFVVFSKFIVFIFLQGFFDFKVMDGSQVIMIV